MQHQPTPYFFAYQELASSRRTKTGLKITNVFSAEWNMSTHSQEQLL
jgi:hypothetical protein